MAKSTHSAPGGSAGLHALAWALLAAAAVGLYVSSYQGWGDPIIDLGRDLYLPSQILEGRVLYRDLLYNYGPAAPYLLAGAVALFGDGLRVFESFGILVGLATLGALYAVGVRLGGVLAGFSAALLFLVLSFFAASTWGCNFVLPYAYAATVGTAFATGSFALLLGYLYGGRSAPSLAWSVALLFAAVLSKPEVGFGIAAVHVLAWWAHQVPRRAVVLTLGAAALLGALFVAAFAARGGGEHALFAENLAKFAGDSGTAEFFKLVAGLDRPGPHLLRALTSAGKLGVVLLLAGFGGLALALAREKRYVRAAAAALALAACAALVWRWADVRLFQAAPLVALGALGYGLARDRKDPLVLLAAFVLFSAPRVVLQFHPMWYGFYLVVPSYPFLVYALGARAAARLPARRAAVAALAALAALLLGRFELAMARAYGDKTSVLVTSKGVMRDRPGGRVEAVAAFLDYAETRLAPARPSLVVMPEGVSLNYFTGMPNPTAYYLFTPPEVGSAEVEGRMVRELAAAAPDYLVLTSRDLSEFGRRGIGLDYALELGDWIRGAYDLERVFEGGGEEPWRLVLLRRRDAR